MGKRTLNNIIIISFAILFLHIHLTHTLIHTCHSCLFFALEFQIYLRFVAFCKHISAYFRNTYHISEVAKQYSLLNIQTKSIAVRHFGSEKYTSVNFGFSLIRFLFFFLSLLTNLFSMFREKKFDWKMIDEPENGWDSILDSIFLTLTQSHRIP